MQNAEEAERLCCSSAALNLVQISRAFKNTSAGNLRILCLHPAQYVVFMLLKESINTPEVLAAFDIPVMVRPTLAPSVLEAWEFNGVHTKLLCTLTDLAIPIRFGG